MRRRLAVLAVLANLALASQAQAQACRVSQSAEQIIEAGYQSGAIVAVAEVTVAEAHYTSQPAGEAHPWTVQAEVDRMLLGEHQEKAVQFARGSGSAACDDGQPLPKAGERWIVYFSRDPRRGEMPWQAFPLAVAASADPSLALLLDSLKQPV